MPKSVKLLGNLSIGIALATGGYFFSKKVNKPKIVYAGNLRIDNSEPDEPPKLFLELTTDLNDICRADTIKLKVIEKDYLDSKTVQ